MSFFGNEAINRLNLQSGIQSLAQGAGQLFLLVFLLRAGISIPVALLVQAAIVVGRFSIRPLILPLAIRWGLKPLVIAGALGLAAQYPILAEVHGVGPALTALCIAAAVAEVLYYVSANAAFAALGDAAFRGHQVAIAQVLAALAGVVAPLAGAWALLTAGPRWTFAGVACVQALSAVPLFGLPNIGVRRSAPDAWRAARPAALLIALDGWFDASFQYVWQIALFVALGASYSAYGGAMAIAGLVGALFGMLVGRHVDSGHGRRATVLAAVVTGTVVIVRAASLRSPLLAAAANALGGFVMPLMVPPLVVATHNIAKASSCPLRVKMATEGAWDIGCLCCCVVAAELARLGASLSIGVLLALPATLISARLLWRYYSPKED